MIVGRNGIMTAWNSRLYYTQYSSNVGDNLEQAHASDWRALCENDAIYKSSDDGSQKEPLRPSETPPAYSPCKSSFNL